MSLEIERICDIDKRVNLLEYIGTADKLSGKKDGGNPWDLRGKQSWCYESSILPDT